MALEIADCSSSLAKEIKRLLASLEIKFGHGKAPKRKGKGKKEVKVTISATWLVGQIYQTLDRLMPELDMRNERACLLMALKALQVR